MYKTATYRIDSETPFRHTSTPAMRDCTECHRVKCVPEQGWSPAPRELTRCGEWGDLTRTPVGKAAAPPGRSGAAHARGGTLVGDEALRGGAQPPKRTRGSMRLQSEHRPQDGTQGSGRLCSGAGDAPCDCGGAGQTGAGLSVHRGGLSFLSLSPVFLAGRPSDAGVPLYRRLPGLVPARQDP